MFDANAAAIIAVTAIVTALIRFLPFMIFGRGGKKPPEFISYLSSVLPCAVMAMLVVYCLRNVNFTQCSNWLPELIACAIVAGLHLWKRNTLLSIIAGTAAYMILTRFVF